MAVIERSASVGYEASKMLALVNDIEAYPAFLHWCHAARIEKTEGNIVEAALEIGVRGIHKTMRTRNTTDPGGGKDKPATIQIELLQGPLEKLHGSWTFRAHESNGCEIVLRLEYETRRTPFGLLLRTLFDEIANSQLHAFVRRADALFGRD
jgi:ribosome-associated toxin RatA of RatAB toxin-antitoxin module